MKSIKHNDNIYNFFCYNLKWGPYEKCHRMSNVTHVSLIWLTIKQKFELYNKYTFRGGNDKERETDIGRCKNRSVNLGNESSNSRQCWPVTDRSGKLTVCTAICNALCIFFTLFTKVVVSVAQTTFHFLHTIYQGSFSRTNDIPFSHIYVKIIKQPGTRNNNIFLWF